MCSHVLGCPLCIVLAVREYSETQSLSASGECNWGSPSNFHNLRVNGEWFVIIKAYNEQQFKIVKLTSRPFHRNLAIVEGRIVPASKLYPFCIQGKGERVTVWIGRTKTWPSRSSVYIMCMSVTMLCIQSWTEGWGSKFDTTKCRTTNISVFSKLRILK